MRRRNGPSITPNELDRLWTGEFPALKFPSGAAFRLAHSPSLAHLPVIHSWITPANVTVIRSSARPYCACSLVAPELPRVPPVGKGTMPYQALRLPFFLIPVLYHPVEGMKVVGTEHEGFFSDLEVTRTLHHSGREAWMRGGPRVTQVHESSVDVLVGSQVSDHNPKILYADEVAEHSRYLSWLEVRAAGDEVFDDGADGSVQAVLCCGFRAPVVNVPFGWVDLVLLLEDLSVLFLEEKLAVALDSQILSSGLLQAAKHTAFTAEEFVMMIKFLSIRIRDVLVGPVTPGLPRVELELTIVSSAFNLQKR